MTTAKVSHNVPVEARVESLAHDGRGIARVDNKTVFVDGALSGELVRLAYLRRRRQFDEAVVQEVLQASPDRVRPRCRHFGICGGCALQHLAPAAQVAAKQRVLLDNLERLGKVQPESVLEPLIGPTWGYRRKGRLGVKYVRKKEKVLVGFRERRSNLVAELERCEVLEPVVGEHLQALAELIQSLEARERIPQVEVAVAQEGPALVFRHLVPLSEHDREALRRFAQTNGFLIFVQPGGPDTVAPLGPDRIRLSYRLAAHSVTLRFEPTDFTQINAAINEAMVARALDLLGADPDDRVLDLFCGLGNFTLPIARHVRAVIGVEGDRGLVARARENAALNGLDNVAFHTADLTQDLRNEPWWNRGFDKVLLDPPRTGAWETLEHLARCAPSRIVYVSCNPATLARDAGYLVNEAGWRLASTGVMDMFPHTAHVESIALFVR